MPDWKQYARIVLPPLAALPPARRKPLAALARFLEGLEERLLRDCARGGTTLQADTLDLLPALSGSKPPPAGTERLVADAKTADLTAARMTALLDGLQVDLVQRRFRDRTQLRQYARLRAGVPIEAALLLLGCAEEKATPLSHALGEGITLLGVLLYLRSDLDAGRMYLPQHLLDAHGVAETEVVSGGETEGWTALLSELAGEIDALLARGGELDDILPDDDARKWAAEALENLRRWLREVEKAGGPPEALEEPRRAFLGGLLRSLLGKG